MRCLRTPKMITCDVMKSVLAPVDLSAAAADVVSEAGALAGNVGGKVLLLHVVAPPAVINEYAAESERLAEEETREAERRLEHWRQRLRGLGTDAEATVLHGPPVATILEEAARTDAQYIVMGSHGHGALYNFFVGGTAGGVIHKATCPVVIVPGPKAEAHTSLSNSKTA
jgi:nucleotide-binding universal stress UspA family protein